MKTTFVSLQVVQGNQFLQLLKKANKILQAVSKRFLTLFTSHKSVTIELVTFRSRKPIIAKKNVTFRFLSSPILTQIEIIIFQSKIVVDRSYFFIFVCYFFFSIPARKTPFHAFVHFVVSHGIDRLLQKKNLFEFTGYFPLFLRKMRDIPQPVTLQRHSAIYFLQT